MKGRGLRHRAENSKGGEHRRAPDQMHYRLARNRSRGIKVCFRILVHCLSPSISISFWLDASVSEFPQMSGMPGDSSMTCNSPLLSSWRTPASEVAIISAAFSGETMGTSAPQEG